MIYPLTHHAKLRAGISAEGIKPLKTIPGVGAAIAKDLYLLGIRQVSDLKERSPEALFKDLCQLLPSRYKITYCKSSPIPQSPVSIPPIVIGILLPGRE